MKAALESAAEALEPTQAATDVLSEPNACISQRSEAAPTSDHPTGKFGCPNHWAQLPLRAVQTIAGTDQRLIAEPAQH